MCVLPCMADIQVIDARTLEKTDKHIETPDKTFNNTINGKYSPYGITGYIVNECTIVCSDCIKGENRNPKNAIHTDNEWDFPGGICEKCNNTLDTYLLVYEDNDPMLHYRLKMSKYMGEYNKVVSIEEIEKYISNEAYDTGYVHGPTDMPKDATIQDIDISMFTESPTYINSIAPELRALCGYEDSKGETYTEVPNDTAYHLFHDNAFPSFHNGYIDKVKELMDN